MPSAQNMLNDLTYGQSESDAKLGETILYIASKDENCGGTRLNKILWKADQQAFAKLKKSITDAQYMREKFGPVPRHLKRVQDRLIAERDIFIRPDSVYGRPRNLVVAMRDADLDVFSPWEVAILDAVIEEERGKTARQMSDESHGRAWEIAGENGAFIPYEACAISDEPMDSFDIALAEQIAAECGWDYASSDSGRE